MKSNPQTKTLEIEQDDLDKILQQINEDDERLKLNNPQNRNKYKAVIDINSQIIAHKLETVVINDNLTEKHLELLDYLFSLPNRLSKLIVTGETALTKEYIKQKTSNIKEIVISSQKLENAYIGAQEESSVIISQKNHKKSSILSEENVIEIAKIIKENTNELIVEGDMVSEDVERIFKILEKHPKITKFSIKGDISRVRVQLEEKLRNNNTLKSIHPILTDPTDIKFITNPLIKHNYINSLDLSDFSIGNDYRAFLLLRDALIETTTLEELAFNQETGLVVKKNSPFMNALMKNTSLCKIKLSGSNIKEIKEQLASALNEHPCISHEITIEMQINNKKLPISTKVTPKQKEKSKEKNQELIVFINELLNVDNIISSTKGTVINNSKQKLADMLYGPLAKVLDNKEHPYNLELTKLLSAEAAVKQKLAHAVIDSLSEINLESAKFKYQSFKLSQTYLLDKMFEFIYGIVMFACGDKGVSLDKLFKSKTELIVQDQNKFVDSVNKITNSEKSEANKSLDDGLNYILKRSARGKWADKVDKGSANLQIQ